VVDIDGIVFVHFVGVDYVVKVVGYFFEDILIGCFLG
jgi:hypothetical protein